MKFWQAMRALEEGKSVRCEYWKKNDYIDKSNICKWFETTPACHHVFDEWELYEEPVQIKLPCGHEDRQNRNTLSDGSILIVCKKCGWSLVFRHEKPEQTYTFAEVVQGLKLGKRYKRKSWPNKEYEIQMSGPGICISYTSKAWYSQPEDYEATDWIEVK